MEKRLRLIEFFAGYGSQHKALDYLDLEVESWKTCEWAVKSIQALKDLHFKDDNNDYSKDLTKEDLVEFLTNKGISANYNEPMSEEQIKMANTGDNVYLKINAKILDAIEDVAIEITI